MRNLDQIRAATALQAATNHASQIDKQSSSKLPAMIIANGLLATAAFAAEKGEHGPKRPEMSDAMKAVAQHLGNSAFGITVLKDCSNADMLINRLSGATSTSADLQRATAEALAFLSYLKRFATKD